MVDFYHQAACCVVDCVYHSWKPWL
jgi:hypothetical protein